MTGNTKARRALRIALPPHADMKGVADVLLYDETSFHFLAEALPHIIWTAEPDGTVDYMNSRWFEYTGLTEHETYAETRTAVHPDDLGEYKRRWRMAIRTSEPYEMEYRFRRAADGEYRWHLGRGVPVKDDYGKVLKWFGTCTDIQAQKEAEEEVRLLNRELEKKVRKRTMDLEKEMQERMNAEETVRSNFELLKTMIDTMPVAAAAADRNHSILHANEFFRQLFAPDVSAEKMAGVDCIGLISAIEQRFMPSDDYDNVLKAIVTNSMNPLRYELPARDGKVYAFDYLPITEGNYQRGYLLLYRDVSKEKRINRAKTEFMSLASHQLRTPLTSVRWALSLLQKRLVGKIGSEDTRLLERAKLSVQSMAQTITTMLSISRIEAQMLSLHYTSINLHDFLQEIQSEYYDECTDKQIYMYVDCSRRLCIETDAKLLKEIIENLVTNAVKYTPSGGDIHIKAKEQAEYIDIRIADTGCGIPKDQQHKLFSKFFRAENAMQIDTEGTGLGLYLVYQLVQLLRGSIRYTSEEGKGTEFNITFPTRAESE